MEDVPCEKLQAVLEGLVPTIRERKCIECEEEQVRKLWEFEQRGGRVEGFLQWPNSTRSEGAECLDKEG